MRPKPQLMKVATAPTSTVSMTPCAGVLARLAMDSSALLMGGAVANAVPVTTTKAICMEKASKPHAPLPQAIAICKGPAPAAGIAATKTMIDKMTAKMNASGKNLFMNKTHALVNRFI